MPIHTVSFVDQVNLDQKRYSRYVCDSRAIPNEVDGLKPVQRRILWTMWNSVAKNHYTKTVKVAGLVMGYHPHGDTSIQDAISAMTQDFTFANNYPLLSGEGTFGDVLDPKAIASPRYTEVRLSEFAKDAGLFESNPDIEYVPNYDETTVEPVYFVPKIPLVLLNNISGIATGFRSSIPGHRLTDLVDTMILLLKKKKVGDFPPWYKGFGGDSRYWRNDNDQLVFTTGFGFKKKEHRYHLVAAPQNWAREKVMDYLDGIVSDDDSPLRDYLDHSTDHFNIELIAKKGVTLGLPTLKELFSKKNNEIVVMNVITSQGRLVTTHKIALIKRFIQVRKDHLIKRFIRLAKLEKEKIDKNSELIRFIKEDWNQKVTKIKNKADFEERLKKAKYRYFEWLAGIPVYRMTIEEVKKCETIIFEATSALARFNELASEDKKLTRFIIKEITELKEKWDKSRE